ncbi:hypothetical protein CCACVL1_05486 [Corchorus capsularis]|uniref:Uncharacterized protein n=1 Tax=Corchorus capsularis TaxID=210143 RepID=A0A1R3JK52_COCAP|nr:hypothetical protein CCACVL1_05486 [Corchorus capsularis]
MAHSPTHGSKLVLLLRDKLKTLEEPPKKHSLNP